MKKYEQRSLQIPRLRVNAAGSPPGRLQAATKASFSDEMSSICEATKTGLQMQRVDDSRDTASNYEMLERPPSAIAGQ